MEKSSYYLHFASLFGDSESFLRHKQGGAKERVRLIRSPFLYGLVRRQETRQSVRTLRYGHSSFLSCVRVAVLPGIPSVIVSVVAVF